MSDIIKQIEDAQLKSDIPAFRAGDTVRVRYAETLKDNGVRLCGVVHDHDLLYLATGRFNVIAPTPIDGVVR